MTAPSETLLRIEAAIRANPYGTVRVTVAHRQQVTALRDYLRAFHGSPCVPCDTAAADAMVSGPLPIPSAAHRYRQTVYLGGVWADVVVTAATTAADLVSDVVIF